MFPADCLLRGMVTFFEACFIDYETWLKHSASNACWLLRGRDTFYIELVCSENSLIQKIVQIVGKMFDDPSNFPFNLQRNNLSCYLGFGEPNYAQVCNVYDKVLAMIRHIHMIFKLSRRTMFFQVMLQSLIDSSDSFTRVTCKYCDSDGCAWHLSPTPSKRQRPPIFNCMGFFVRPRLHLYWTKERFALINRPSA